MGGKSSTSTSQVQIPAEVLARYNAVNARAEQAATTPFHTYGGEFVAMPNAQQQAGMGQTAQYAQAAQPFINAATGQTLAAQQATGAYNAPAYQFGMGAGQAVNPSDLNAAAINKYMSPYLQNVAQSTEALINQQNQQAMAGQLGNAIQSGAFGGDRAGIAAANLAQQQQLAGANIYSNLLNQGYNQALQTAAGQQALGLQAGQANRAAQAQAAQLMAGLGQTAFGQQMATGQQLAGLGAQAQGLGLQGAQANIAAGGVQQQAQQALDQALYNQFLQQQSYPFQVAQFLANIAEGTGALSGSQTVTTQPGGFFSDERLKEDIKPVGKTFDGQNIYSYKMRHDPAKRTQIGLLAQEVEHHHPEAVGLAGGYKTVDYDKATSMGGHVGSEHAGEEYARGGLARAAYADGGESFPNPGTMPNYNVQSVFNPFDIQAYMQQVNAFAPHQQAGLPLFSQPHGGTQGYVPQAAMHVGNLAVAHGPDRPMPTAAEQVHKLAETNADMRSLWKGDPKTGGGLEDLVSKARAKIHEYQSQSEANQKLGETNQQIYNEQHAASHALKPDEATTLQSVTGANDPANQEGGENLLNIGDETRSARGGFMRRKGLAAGGDPNPDDLPYGDQQKTPTHLDIPEENPAAKLAVASDKSGSGGSGLGNVMAMLQLANIGSQAAGYSGIGDAMSSMFAALSTGGVAGGRIHKQVAGAAGSEEEASDDQKAPEEKSDAGLAAAPPPAQPEPTGLAPPDKPSYNLSEFANREGLNAPRLNMGQSAIGSPLEAGTGVMPKSILDQVPSTPRKGGLNPDLDVRGETGGKTGDGKGNLFHTISDTILGAFKDKNGNYDQSKIIPFMNFVAGMGTAPTRSFGVALAAGMGSAAQSLAQQQQMGMTQQQIGIEKFGAQTTRYTALLDAKQKLLRQLGGIKQDLQYDPRNPPPAAVALEKQLQAVDAELSQLSAGEPGAGSAPVIPGQGIERPEIPAITSGASTAAAPSAPTEEPASAHGNVIDRMNTDPSYYFNKLHPYYNPQTYLDHASLISPYDPAAAMQLRNHGLALQKEIETKGYGTGKNGEIIYFPPYQARRLFEENKDSSNELYRGLQNDAPQRAQLGNRLDNMAKILERYEPGRGSKITANLADYLRTLFGTEESSRTADFDEFNKNSLGIIFNQMAGLKGHTAVETQNKLSAITPSTEMTPSANKKILSQYMAALQYENDRAAAAMKFAAEHGGLFDAPTFNQEFAKTHDLDTMAANIERNLAVRGEVKNWKQMRPGYSYIITPEDNPQFAVVNPATGKQITGPTKIRFKGIGTDPKTGITGPDVEFLGE